MRGYLKITMMDEHYTFHVGERVQIKEWTEMAEEYKELNNESHLNSHIDLPGGVPFTSPMRHLCGKEATITRIYSGGTIDLEDIDTAGRTGWHYTLSMIKPIEFDPAPQINKPNWDEIFYNKQ